MNVGQIMKGQYMVFTFFTESNEELKDIKLGRDMIRFVSKEKNCGMGW